MSMPWKNLVTCCLVRTVIGMLTAGCTAGTFRRPHLA